MARTTWERFKDRISVNLFDNKPSTVRAIEKAVKAVMNESRPKNRAEAKDNAKRFKDLEPTLIYPNTETGRKGFPAFKMVKELMEKQGDGQFFVPYEDIRKSAKAEAARQIAKKPSRQTLWVDEPYEETVDEVYRACIQAEITELAEGSCSSETLWSKSEQLHTRLNEEAEHIMTAQCLDAFDFALAWCTMNQLNKLQRKEQREEMGAILEDEQDDKAFKKEMAGSSGLEARMNRMESNMDEFFSKMGKVADAFIVDEETPSRLTRPGPDAVVPPA